MNTTDDLSAVMSRLHEPTPPASVKATAMARIAREADRQPATAERSASAPDPREWPVWLLATAGLVVVLGANAYGWLEGRPLPDFTSSRIGHRLAMIPMEGSMALFIGLGLVIYLAGLVAPLRSGSRR